MQRVSVVGTVGSGKSTFARALARRLRAPYVELDALHWGPGWTPASDAAMRERVSEAIAGDAWVIGGNHGARSAGWSGRAPTRWCGSTHRCSRRSSGCSPARSAARWVRTELFNANRETFREAFLSRDSILLFTIRTARSRRRTGEERWAQPEYRHLTVHRFRSQAQADRWLASVPDRASSGTA